jgi:hypothetical protein
LQDLILHHSLEHQGCSVVVLLQALNQVTERLDNIEALLEKRQKAETYQMKEVKRAMLSKIAGQLNHLQDLRNCHSERQLNLRKRHGN